MAHLQSGREKTADDKKFADKGLSAALSAQPEPRVGFRIARRSRPTEATGAVDTAQSTEDLSGARLQATLEEEGRSHLTLPATSRRPAIVQVAPVLALEGARDYGSRTGALDYLLRNSTF
jgi:hypothetical protein